MRNTIIRTVKFTLGILVLMATLGNSGCLVDTGSDLSSLRKLNQAHLRIYKPGDRINYDVLVNGLSKGTLTIAYDLPSPTENPDSDPLTSGTTYIVDLLKETTTLNYSGNEVKTVRYITQDKDPLSASYGSITLHVFNSQLGSTQHDYVSTNNTLDLNNPLVPATIFSSPFLDPNTFQPAAGQSDVAIDYYVFQCVETNNTCDPYNQRLTENFELSKMKIYNLTNTVNFFETVQVPYTGTVTSLSLNQRNIYLDMRMFCGDPTDATITYSGSEFLYPSIGVVRFEVNCSSTQYHFLSADISSVNFSY